MTPEELLATKKIIAAAIDLALKVDVVFVGPKARGREKRGAAQSRFHWHERCTTQDSTVRVVTTRASAEAAGYTACRRCKVARSREEVAGVEHLRTVA